MNTEISDQIVKAWGQKPKQLKRVSFTSQRTFKTSPAELFRLLCPTTEFDWIPGFECELVHSQTGYAEYNAIFRTNVLGPEETWVCTRYEPNRVVEYTSVSEHCCGKLDITLVDNNDGTVTGTWVITRSPLTKAGNLTETELAQGQQDFNGLLDALNIYITTGEMTA